MQTPLSRRVPIAAVPPPVQPVPLHEELEPAPPATELIELRQVAKRLAYEGMPLRLVPSRPVTAAEKQVRPAQVASQGASGAPQPRANGCCLVDETVECDINREETGHWEIGMDTDEFLVQTRVQRLVPEALALPSGTHLLEQSDAQPCASHLLEQSEAPPRATQVREHVPQGTPSLPMPSASTRSAPLPHVGGRMRAMEAPLVFLVGLVFGYVLHGFVG